MNRVQLEHVIRAAATIAGDTEIVVIGSQAILGAIPRRPPSCSSRRTSTSTPGTTPSGPSSSRARSASSRRSTIPTATTPRESASGRQAARGLGIAPRADSDAGRDGALPRAPRSPHLKVRGGPGEGPGLRPHGRPASAGRSTDAAGAIGPHARRRAAAQQGRRPDRSRLFPIGLGRSAPGIAWLRDPIWSRPRAGFPARPRLPRRGTGRRAGARSAPRGDRGGAGGGDRARHRPGRARRRDAVPRARDLHVPRRGARPPHRRTDRGRRTNREHRPGGRAGGDGRRGRQHHRGRPFPRDGDRGRRASRGDRPPPAREGLRRPHPARAAGLSPGTRARRAAACHVASRGRQRRPPRGPTRPCWAVPEARGPVRPALRGEDPLGPVPVVRDPAGTAHPGRRPRRRGSRARGERRPCSSTSGCSSCWAASP